MDLLIFLVSAGTIAYAGTQLSGLADRIADKTGLGEALIGAVLLGASTSIPGVVISTAAAYKGLPQFSISNALGGIAVQTFFLVLADIRYKKVSLEHAAVSTTNLLLSGLLVTLLCLPIVGQIILPHVDIWGVHPITPLFFFVYLFGLHYVREEKKFPMWKPKITKETVEDISDEPDQEESLKRLFIGFAVYAILLIGAGFGIEYSGVNLADKWGINQMVLGTIFTATVTSLPELITTFAAVNRGALTLAVGGIVGGNSFDILFLAFSDIFYREGSIYHVMEMSHISYIAVLILMTIMLMMGFLRREKSGIGNIGTETAVVGLLYLVSLYITFSYEL